jgi:hypothetical protein
MTALEPLPEYPTPERRALQIYAVDPMVSRLSGNETVTISIPYEKLGPGPSGRLVRVIDYDTSRKAYYAPVDLDDPVLLANGGLTPSEGDPRFHQQMTYAVVAALLENFEQGLGYRFRWRGDGSESPLVVMPHAFSGENAYYDPTDGGSVRFGYFRTDPNDPGRNLPGQFVFSCLSPDIIVHETTHALIDRLRPFYKEATNVDVYAFHEGFSDVVALFQHFTTPDLLSRYIQTTRTDLTQHTPLVELAQQFGESTGRGRALRNALGDAPDPAALSHTIEPHARGSIFVAAIFDAFFTTYQAAIADLLRLATMGSGILAAGALQTDLVGRVAAEAQRVAQRLLVMCIRAFQYLPPVDVTFGDFLRSAVTADREANSVDALGMRAALVEAFRKRGVHPTGVSGLADEAVAWPAAPELPPLDVVKVVQPLVFETALGYRARRGHQSGAAAANHGQIQRWLKAYAKENAAALGLVDGEQINVAGFHGALRMGSRGLHRVNVVVQFVQPSPAALRTKQAQRLGGAVLRGGATLVADADGHVLHVVSKATPLAADSSRANAESVARLAAVGEFVDAVDLMDLPGPWRRPKDAGDGFWTPGSRNDIDTRISAGLTLGRLDTGVT